MHRCGLFLSPQLRTPTYPESDRPADPMRAAGYFIQAWCVGDGSGTGVVQRPIKQGLEQPTAHTNTGHWGIIRLCPGCCCGRPLAPAGRTHPPQGPGSSPGFLNGSGIALIPCCCVSHTARRLHGTAVEGRPSAVGCRSEQVSGSSPRLGARPELLKPAAV